MNTAHKTTNIDAGLYIIATPIGNLEDITLRALSTLKSIDIILCEDTGHSQKLLSHYSIKKPLWSYNDHSTESVRHKIVKEISAGKSIALISDAGTPLISDPGYKLVEYAHQNNIFVTACPGACSPINALTISGCPTNKFLFLGFLPTQKKEREHILKTTKSSKASLIIFSTPRKLENDLLEIQNEFGNIQIYITRELTKIFEQRIFNDISNIVSNHKQTPLKGEIIIPPQALQTDINHIQNQIQQLKKNKFSSKDIVKIISITNPDLSKNEIYKLTIT